MPSVFDGFRRLCFDHPLARLRPRKACLRLVKSGWNDLLESRFRGSLVAVDKRLGGFLPGVVPPVRLHEHGFDLFEIDGFGLVADGFDQGADAEVFDDSCHNPPSELSMRPTVPNSVTVEYAVVPSSESIFC
jgi:hypothetical protein